MARALMVRALMVGTLAAACSTAMAVPPVSESFEAGFEQWVKDSSVVGPLPFNPVIFRESERAHSGTWGVRFSARGGNGALWLEKKLTSAPGRYDVKLTFWVWSPTLADVGTWNVDADIGTSDPAVQSDLQVVGRTGQQAGWAQYGLRKTLDVPPGKALWVAFGLGVTSQVDAAYDFDDVTLDIQPACRADFDQSGTVTVHDIFSFLNAWFAGSPAAEFDGVDGLTVRDIFSFLEAWFAGCP